MTGRSPVQTPVFFAHAADATPLDAPLPALQDALGPGYRIIAPDLGPPDPDTWSKRIKDHLTTDAAQAILIGHSLGGSHVLKCLAEIGPTLRPRAFVGLACPMWGLPEWDNPAYALPPWAPEALAHLPMRFFRASDDDLVGQDHLDAYHHAFPHARTHTFSCGGHKFQSDLSALTITLAEL